MVSNGSAYQVVIPAIIGTNGIELIVYEVAGLLGKNSHPSLVAVHCKGQFLSAAKTGSKTIFWWSICKRISYSYYSFTWQR